MRIISQIIASERKENVMMMAKSVEILRKDNDCFQCERELDFKGKFLSALQCVKPHVFWTIVFVDHVAQ